MAKIKHIAITTKDPAKTAEFYKEAFDMQELRRGDSGVFLTDGYINLAILNHKTNEDADVGPNGPNYNGIHHFGFLVDESEDHGVKVEKAGGKRLTSTAPPGTGGLFGMGPGPGNAEVKFSGPDDVVVDISYSGWQTSP